MRVKFRESYGNSQKAYTKRSKVKKFIKRKEHKKERQRIKELWDEYYSSED